MIKSCLPCINENFDWQYDLAIILINLYEPLSIFNRRQSDDILRIFPTHYENMPIQIYRKFHLQKLNFQIKKRCYFFSYFCSKHRLWVLIRTASLRQF